MKANNSIEKPDWSLIAKYLTGEANATETEHVENWAAAADQNQKELEQHSLLLKNTDKFYQLKGFNTNKAWNKIHQRTVSITPSNRFIIFRKKTSALIYKYAAILLIAILLGSAGYFLVKNQMNPVYAEVISGDGQLVNEFVLPDGSTVTLNSNSKLVYPEKFNNQQREVTIAGEAFFDVNPDPDRPFIINAGNARVKVLGTSFNVNAYPEAEAVEVTVKTGIVQVLCCEGEEREGDELLLNAGEKGTVFNGTRKLEKTVNTDRNYLAWKTHTLIFEKTRLAEVVQHLNKVYHTDIQLEDKEIENLLLTAQFEEKSADFILNVIRLTFDLELKQEHGIHILSDKTILNN
jgi:transmembrane sensor